MKVSDLLTGKVYEISNNEVVLWPARVEPPHNMHKEYIIGLTKIFKRVIILIGSANAHGTPRHCIPAITRVKMVSAMLEEAKLSKDKYTIVTMPDYFTTAGDYDDEKWCEKIVKLAKDYGATYVASGNEWVKDILERDETSNLKVIDPDLLLAETYRATDVRNAIIRGDYESLKKMVPFSVLQILLENDCYKGIIMSNENKAVSFLPGRQTVDMVLLLKDVSTEKLYVLLGKRKMDKIDFPGVLALPGGGMEEFEIPTDAIKRVLEEETGLVLNIQDGCFLNDPVKFDNIDTKLLTMKMVGIYSDPNPLKAGSRGGSSQCFSIYIEDDVKRFREVIASKKDLDELDFYEVDSISNTILAFQHSEMLEKAIYMAKAKIKLEKDKSDFANKKSKCICLMGGSGSGKSTAAHGIMYILKLCGISCEFTGEFAKDEVYEGHLDKIIDDQSYIISMQNRRVKRLVDYGVDYIISDAPLPISAYHASSEKPIEELAYYLFDKNDNYIIFVNKDENVKFETKGRAEDEQKSKKISSNLKQSLMVRDYDFVETVGSNDTVVKALEFVANDISDEKAANKIRKMIEFVKKEKEYAI